MTGPVRRAGPADAEVVGRLLFDFNTEFETPTPDADSSPPGSGTCSTATTSSCC